jgi:hypothetical protein
MQRARLLSLIVFALFACLPILQAQEIPSDFLASKAHFNFKEIRRANHSSQNIWRKRFLPDNA